MRGIVWILAAAALSMASGGHAAELVGPKALQSGWLDGRTISTAGPRGGRSDFTFTADGKVSRTGGRAGSASDGTWRLDDDGFCMTLGTARRESCYIALKGDDGSLKVMRRSGSAFTWRR